MCTHLFFSVHRYRCCSAHLSYGFSLDHKSQALVSMQQIGKKSRRASTERDGDLDDDGMIGNTAEDLEAARVRSTNGLGCPSFSQYLDYVANNCRRWMIMATTMMTWI
jgi:hypothetical protein